MSEDAGLFLIFCGEDYEAAGGAADLLTVVDNVFDAIEIAREVIGQSINDTSGFLRATAVEWSHIMDAAI